MGNQDYSGAIKFNRGRANLLNVVAPSTKLFRYFERISVLSTLANLMNVADEACQEETRL
ncbi:hypothetical protein PGT21_027996 [Puccinia graminis f. sp. tritici]|uniref:Uncharacterized protein n=1 Tax=Puccinia graminis f. sp. tritici TaxID=56615 RepID=A0A5B0RS58_PUCGR|nr:hypothetical protein PGT21_027996 [Puccinia graminis f. sp. tritici]KAA1128108.1 hypothetical protein PGTUg99_009288 [Puccinia graminis f. sp. tritici]